MNMTTIDGAVGKFRNLRVGTKLDLGFGPTVLAVIALATLATVRISQVSNEWKQFDHVTLQKQQV
jgi:hypothetical protein